MKFRPLHDRVVVERIDPEAKSAGGIMHPRGLPRAAHRLPVMFLLPWAVNQLRLVGVNGPYSVSLSPANEPEPPLICAARNLKNSDDGQSAF